MARLRWIAVVSLLATCGVASGQSPRVLYTWEGTGNIHEWASDGSSQVNHATLTNAIAGELTVTETGDDFGDAGGGIVIRDGFNRRMESSTASGGLDVTGLEFLEIDVAHNGTGNVPVQFFIQATPAFNYLWGGSNGVLGGPDWQVGPGVNTLKFPIAGLSPAQQAYIRTLGLSVRDHFDQGNLTWTVTEVRSTGTPLTTRTLVSHDTGSSESGLQGAISNFDRTAIVGSDGAANQTGLSHNPTGSGSLQWTDKGGEGTTESPSGAAIAWGNGTEWNGNSFNERLTDVSNYTHVTYRISATDPLSAGGVLGLQAYYQTGPGNWVYQVAGEMPLPIDGAFHDITFPLAGVNDRQNVQLSGLNLFAHVNDLVINVDSIVYNTLEGVLGDYNENGVVDAADYNLWRDNLGANIALPNEGVSTGVVDQQDYDFWKLHFGEGTPGAGGVSTSAVPEPATILSLLPLAAIGWCYRRRSNARS